MIDEATMVRRHFIVAMLDFNDEQSRPKDQQRPWWLRWFKLPEFSTWMDLTTFEVMQEVRQFKRGQCQREHCGCARAPLKEEVIDGETLFVCAWQEGCDL
jgi:hypothetical protein